MISIDRSLERKYWEQIKSIDLDSYGVESGENFVPIAEKCSDSYKLLRSNNEVLGYTLILGLNRKSFEALRDGTIGENELTPRDITGTNPVGLYVASVAGSQRIRNKKRFLSGTLTGLLAGQVVDSSLPIIAIPVTRAGEHLAKIISLRPTETESPTNHSFKIKPRIWIGGTK